MWKWFTVYVALLISISTRAESPFVDHPLKPEVRKFYGKIGINPAKGPAIAFNLFNLLDYPELKLDPAGPARTNAGVSRIAKKEDGKLQVIFSDLELFTPAFLKYHTGLGVQKIDAYSRIRSLQYSDQRYFSESCIALYDEKKTLLQLWVPEDATVASFIAALYQADHLRVEGKDRNSRASLERGIFIKEVVQASVLQNGNGKGFSDEVRRTVVRIVRSVNPKIWVPGEEAEERPSAPESLWALMLPEAPGQCQCSLQEVPDLVSGGRATECALLHEDRQGLKKIRFKWLRPGEGCTNADCHNYFQSVSRDPKICSAYRDREVNDVNVRVKTDRVAHGVSPVLREHLEGVSVDRLLFKAPDILAHEDGDIDWNIEVPYADIFFSKARKSRFLEIGFSRNCNPRIDDVSVFTDLNPARDVKVAEAHSHGSRFIYDLSVPEIRGNLAGFRLKAVIGGAFSPDCRVVAFRYPTDVPTIDPIEQIELNSAPYLKSVRGRLTPHQEPKVVKLPDDAPGARVAVVRRASQAGKESVDERGLVRPVFYQKDTTPFDPGFLSGMYLWPTFYKDGLKKNTFLESITVTQGTDQWPDKRVARSIYYCNEGLCQCHGSCPTGLDDSYLDFLGDGSFVLFSIVARVPGVRYTPHPYPYNTDKGLNALQGSPDSR